MTTDLEQLRKALPAAFYKPNKPCPEELILAFGGMPGSKSLGDAVWFESDAQLRIGIGGNRAGKTTKLILEAGSFCIGCRPWYPPDSPWFTRGLKSLLMEKSGRPARIRYVVPSFSNHLSEVITEFKKWWPQSMWSVTSKDNYNNPKEITFFNGAVVNFMSHHMDPKDFEGIEVDANFWDEPPPRELWTGLERGNVSSGGRTCVGSTLLDASGWFWEEIVAQGEDPDQTEVLVTWHSIWDNIAENGGCPSQLGKNVALWLCAKITDPDERMAREHGFPMHVGGLVLKDFSSANIVEPFDLPDHCVIASCIDPAGSRPYAGLHVAFFEVPGGEWEGHWFDETYLPQHRADLRGFCEEWIAKEEGKTELRHPHPSALMLIDPFANEPQKLDEAGRSMRQILADDYGIHTRPADRRNKRGRLLSLNSRFRSGHYKVWSTCKRFLLERRRWTWDPKSPKLVKGSDDICDCGSYIDAADPAMKILRRIEGEDPGGVWVPPEYRERERRADYLHTRNQRHYRRKREQRGY